MKAFVGHLLQLKARAEYRAYSRRRRELSADLSFTEAACRFPDRNKMHAYMHHYLHHIAPPSIRAHRDYYKQERRGFGEDALHAMWWTLLREFRPAVALEIGVYRGQVVSLWGLVAKLNGFPCEVHGISPFSPAGDLVSTYRGDIDYLEDTRQSNRRFGLTEPQLLTALSTDAHAVDFVKSLRWDLTYIDGNHDFDVAVADYRLCRDALAKGGILVLDDSSLFTSYRPQAFGFAGHPGPSRVAKELAMKELRFLGGVGHNNVFQKA